MPFEPSPPDESLYKCHRVYALIDHVEPEAPERNEPCDVFFDCIDSDWVEERTRRVRVSLETCLEARTSIIRLPTRWGGDPFTGDAALQEDWLTLYLDNEPHGGSYPIEHYASINHVAIN